MAIKTDRLEARLSPAERALIDRAAAYTLEDRRRTTSDRGWRWRHRCSAQPTSDRLCLAFGRHPRTHIRGIGPIGIGEPQTRLTGLESFVVVGPVPPFCGRGGT